MRTHNEGDRRRRRLNHENPAQVSQVEWQPECHALYAICTFHNIYIYIHTCVCACSKKVRRIRLNSSLAYVLFLFFNIILPNPLQRISYIHVCLCRLFQLLTCPFPKHQILQYFKDVMM